MALKKEIELENGIVLNYHRITSFNKITNVANNVEISSYTNEKQRAKEKEYQQVQTKNLNLKENEQLTKEEQDILYKGIDVYVNSTYYQLPYDENQTIEDVYNYLKTTDKFKGAEDVLEGGKI